jgi:hypothetical protein
MRARLVLLLEYGFRILPGTFQCPHRRIIVVQGKKIRRLCAHHMLDRVFVAHVIQFRQERGYFIQVFFVGHWQGGWAVRTGWEEIVRAV